MCRTPSLAHSLCDYSAARLQNMSFRSVPELVDYYIEVNDGWAKPLNRTGQLHSMPSCSFSSIHRGIGVVSLYFTTKI